jgi:hypothetical protein
MIFFMDFLSNDQNINEVSSWLEYFHLNLKHLLFEK